METRQDDNCWYEKLIRWIHNGGGYVHPHLNYFQQDTSYRGIIAKDDKICKGECLIRLPKSLILCGDSFPSTYTTNTNNETQKNASPWLRCLASYWEQVHTSKKDKETTFAPYIESLPANYSESLLYWSSEDLSQYLKGTTLGDICQSDRTSKTTQTHWNLNVRPYLLHLGYLSSKEERNNIDGEYSKFLQACACISTRGFHKATNQNHSDNEKYSGPYLLPYMDLLNHCSKKEASTSLRVDENNGDFYMQAERDIEKGDEICHCYQDDDTTTSSQWLQTFGFIPMSSIQQQQHEDTHTSYNSNKTCATVSQDMIIKSCEFIANSQLPIKLKKIIHENNQLCQESNEEYEDENEDEDEDEVWELEYLNSLSSKEMSKITKRDLSTIIGQDVIIPHHIDTNEKYPFPKELITSVVIPFLPQDIFMDWIQESALLDESIFEDYYLGNLALSAIHHLLEIKISQYYDEKLNSSYQNALQKIQNERLILRNNTCTSIKQGNDNKKYVYGLTIRLEEQESLLSLKRHCLKLQQTLFHDEGDANIAQDLIENQVVTRKRPHPS